MDIRIEKKKGIRALFTKKGIPYLAGALFLVFVLWLLLRDNSSPPARPAAASSNLFSEPFCIFASQISLTTNP